MTAADGTWLDRIVVDVRARRAAVDPAASSRRAGVERNATRTVSMVASIADRRDRGELAVIAEVKRRSPSRGVLAPDLDPAMQARSYAAAGAAAVSVLTEQDHFGGSFADLERAREELPDHVPVLCKDFVLDDAHLADARAAGADAVLLIAALHPTAERLERLIVAAHGLALEVLLEVHDEHEVALARATSADLVGINNRDLRSFRVDLGLTERLAPMLCGEGSGGCPVVAESGIATAADARRMQRAGASAVLVGEALVMPGVDIATRIGELACATSR